MGPLHAAWVFMVLVLATAAQETKHLEIDVIFPRNETYKAVADFPVALAIQNATALGALGNYTLSWIIMPYTDGVIASGLSYGGGKWVVPAEAKEPVIFVGTSNVTAWIKRKKRGDRYMLGWSVVWDGVVERCGFENTFISGGLMFGVEGAFESDPFAYGWEDAGKGKTPDILQVPECPALGAVADITPSATTSPASCPTVVGDTGRKGNPCAVKVDKAMASSISSQVSVLAKPTPTPTPTWVATTWSTAAAEAACPVQTALAAACFLGTFILASCT